MTRSHGTPCGNYHGANCAAKVLGSGCLRGEDSPSTRGARADAHYARALFLRNAFRRPGCAHCDPFLRPLFDPLLSPQKAKTTVYKVYFEWLKSGDKGTTEEQMARLDELERKLKFMEPKLANYFPKDAGH